MEQRSFLTVWGTIVVGSIDNLLYPILVKDQLSLHTVPTFISILGGSVWSFRAASRSPHPYVNNVLS